MALSSTARGTGTHNSSATSFTLSPGGNFAAGSTAVLAISADNSHSGGTAFSTYTVTDTLGNTWVRRSSPLQDPGAASAGVEGAIFTTYMNGGTLTTGTTITVTYDTATTAKVWVLWQITPTSGYQAQFVADLPGGGGGNSATPSLNTGTLVTNDIIVCAVCVEQGTGATITADSDTLNGSWSTAQVAQVGSGSAGQSISSQTKVLSGTTEQQYTPSFGGPYDLAICGISLRDVALTQTITASGIATAEALGTAVVTRGAVAVTLTGIATAEALGTAVVTRGAVAVTLTGIATAEALGTAVVTRGAVAVTLTGIATDEALGTIVVTPPIAPTYNDSVIALNPISYWRLGESSGTNAVDEMGVNAGTYTNSPTLGAASLIEDGSNTAVSLDGTAGKYVTFGNDASLQLETATILCWIKTSGAGSGYRRFFAKDGSHGMFLVSNVLGAFSWGGYSGFHSSGVDVADGQRHMVAWAQQPFASGDSVLYLDGEPVWTGQAGVANQSFALNIGDAYSLGQDPTIVVDEAAIWGSMLPGTDIANLWAIGTTPSGAPTLYLSGIASAEALGVPTVTPGAVGVSLSGIATEEALGAPTVTPGAVAVTLSGIDTAEALGAPTVTPGAVGVSLAGIATQEALGITSVTPGAVTISLSGMPSQEALGATQITVGAVGLTLTGIETAEAWGVLTVTSDLGSIALDLAGIATAEAFGTVSVGRGAVALTGVGGIASWENFGMPVIRQQQIVPLTKLSLMMDGLATALDTLTLVPNIYSWPSPSVTVPCGLVAYPTEINFDVTFHRGGDTFHFPVYFLAGKADNKASRDELSNVINGATSIKEALDGEHSFGTELVKDAVIEEVNVGAVAYAGAKFSVEVIG